MTRITMIRQALQARGQRCSFSPSSAVLNWIRSLIWSLTIVIGLHLIEVPCVLLVFAADEISFEGKVSDYNGYRMYESRVDGRHAVIVAPRKAVAGRPWIWRAEFFNAFPQVDLALLEKGFHLVYIDVGNTFGCPDAMQHWNVFYLELTEKYGLSRKPVLEGLSRGGLYCFNWAGENPEKVACILADNAVLDFKSWPGGKGRAKGSPGDWQKLLADYHFASEAEALAYPKNPIDNLEPLARGKVALFLLCNAADEGVPYAENSGIVKQRYLKLGGEVEELIKQHLGHHPHGMIDPTPVVDFIVKHSLPAGSPVTTAVEIQARPADAFVDSIGINVHLAYADTSYARFSEIVRPRLKESGIRHIRDICPPHWNDDQRAKINDLAQDGIRALLICSPKLGSIDQIVDSLKKMQSSVEAVEGPNEPDGEGLKYQEQSFPESVRTYQNDLFAAIKQDPVTRAFPVIASAISNPENAAKVGSFSQSTDFANTHCYADGGPPGFQWDWYLDRSRINSDRPVVATETGYHNSINHTEGLWIPGISEVAAGKYLSRLFPEYFLRGIVRTYVYELIDERHEPLNAENNLGIVHVDGQPKPAFQSIKNTIALLSDPGQAFTPASLRFNIVTENALVRYLLLQKRNGQFCLLLWQNTSSFDTRSKLDVEVVPQRTIIELSTPFKAVEAFLPMQSCNAVKQFTSDQSIEVNVPDQLMILQITLN